MCQDYQVKYSTVLTKTTDIVHNALCHTLQHVTGDFTWESWEHFTHKYTTEIGKQELLHFDKKIQFPQLL